MEAMKGHNETKERKQSNCMEINCKESKESKNQAAVHFIISSSIQASSKQGRQGMQ
jgi:hypothetical protein